MSQILLWVCVAGWLVGCTCRLPQEARLPSQVAVVTTEASRSTLVISDLSEVVAVHRDIERGDHEIADLPPDAAVSKITGDDEVLVIETVHGVRAGQTLWKTARDAVGTVEVGKTPVPLSEHSVEWVLAGARQDDKLGPARQLRVLQDDLNADGTLDLFLRVTENGVPVATGFSTDVPVTPRDPGLPTARAEISGWRETPTLVELQYVNTTTNRETIELDVDGFRGTKWVGWGSRHAADSFIVEPGDVTLMVDALDPAFHSGFFARAKRVQSGAGQGEYAELRVRHPVPAPGDKGTFVLTSADIPHTFKSVRLDPLARQVHLDWTGVTCKDVGYVILQAHVTLRQSETGRLIEWTMVSPASDLIQFPRLPPDTEEEVDQAMVDPSFAQTISVEALAVDASYARAAGLEGQMTPADVGNYSCLVMDVVTIR